MEPEVLIFMPNGDVTLTLVRNVYEEDDQPTKSFPPRKKRRLSVVQQTPIDENKQWEVEDRELEDVLEDESMLFYAPDAPNAGDGPSHPPTPRGGRGSDASSRRDRSSSPPASFWAQLKRQQAARNETAVEEDEVIAEPESVKKERKLISSHEVHCIVSSKHMINASHIFESLLAGDSAEAKLLRAKGHTKLQVLADFDTMVILLNVIHGPSRKVPRQVTLTELSNLAILASKLGMTETVQFFSDTWIDALQREGLPRSYNQAVLQLLLVFHVFDRPDEFKSMSRLVQRECDENLLQDSESIPIPRAILDAIKQEREDAINTAITTVHNLITRYMDGKTICDASLDDDLQYACDAMILGSLMKSARKIDIWPKPEAPFAGRKFKDVAQAIKAIRIVDVCNRSSRRFANLGSASNGHGLENEIEASLKNIEAGMDGLELLQYAKKSNELVTGLELFLLDPEVGEDEADSVDSEETMTNSHMYTESTTTTESTNGDKRLEEIEEITLIPQASSSASIVPEIPDLKPPRPEPSTDHFRIQSPFQDRAEVEDTIQDRFKQILQQQPPKPALPDSHNVKQQDNSRVSSRASDYQVQEPTRKDIRSEQHSTLAHYSPTQSWTGSGHLASKSSIDSNLSWDSDGTRTPTESYRPVGYNEIIKDAADTKPSTQSKLAVENDSDADGPGDDSTPISEMIFRGEQIYTRTPPESSLDRPAYFPNNQNHESISIKEPVETSPRRKEVLPLSQFGGTPSQETPNKTDVQPKVSAHNDTILTFRAKRQSILDRSTSQEKENQANNASITPSDPSTRSGVSSSTEKSSKTENYGRSTYLGPGPVHTSKEPSPPPQASVSQPRNTTSSMPTQPQESPTNLTQSQKLSQAVSQLEAARAYIERQASNNKPSPPPEPLRRAPRDSYSQRRTPPTELGAPASLPVQAALLAQTTNKALQQATSSPQLHKSQQSSSQTPYISSKLSQSIVAEDERPTAHVMNESYANGQTGRQIVSQPFDRRSDHYTQQSYPSVRTPQEEEGERKRPVSHTSQASLAEGRVVSPERKQQQNYQSSIADSGQRSPTTNHVTSYGSIQDRTKHPDAQSSHINGSKAQSTAHQQTPSRAPNTETTYANDKTPYYGASRDKKPSPQVSLSSLENESLREGDASKRYSHLSQYANRNSYVEGNPSEKGSSRSPPTASSLPYINGRPVDQDRSTQNAQHLQSQHQNRQSPEVSDQRHIRDKPQESIRPQRTNPSVAHTNAVVVEPEVQRVSGRSQQQTSTSYIPSRQSQAENSHQLQSQRSQHEVPRVPSPPPRPQHTFQLPDRSRPNNPIQEQENSKRSPPPSRQAQNFYQDLVGNSNGKTTSSSSSQSPLQAVKGSYQGQQLSDSNVGNSGREPIVEKTEWQEKNDRKEVESPEADESWEQPHKFNMRKSKKKFSTRF